MLILIGLINPVIPRKLPEETPVRLPISDESGIPRLTSQHLVYKQPHSAQIWHSYPPH